jgi:hypothetical protein
MPQPTLDADTILKRATPVTGQHAHELQPYGHLVRMPIALSEHTCKESVSSTRPTLVRSGIARETTPTCLRRSSEPTHHADTTWA